MNMKELGEGIRVGFIGAAGFITQMTNLDVVLKVLIGAATLFYIVGKTVKMIRDWNQKDDE